MKGLLQLIDWLWRQIIRINNGLPQEACPISVRRALEQHIRLIEIGRLRMALKDLDQEEDEPEPS
jgi:hypothetical protein